MKVLIGNSANFPIKIPQHSLKFRAEEEDIECKYVIPKDVTENDLNQGPIKLMRAPKGKSIPHGFESFYDTMNLCDDLNNIEKEDFNMNNVCQNCVVNKRNYAGIHKIHIKTPELEKFDVSRVEPIASGKTNSNILHTEDIHNGGESNESFNDYFKDLECAGENDLMPNEIGIPTFKTQTEIEVKVHEKLKGLPTDVYNLLYPAFLRNESLMKSSWDVPKCSQKLHFELKEGMPKQTRVYPIKSEYKSSLFATMQFLTYFGIIERAPVHQNFGSPQSPEKNCQGGAVGLCAFSSTCAFRTNL
jgi:hypothetical protein